MKNILNNNQLLGTLFADIAQEVAETTVVIANFRNPLCWPGFGVSTEHFASEIST